MPLYKEFFHKHVYDDIKFRNLALNFKIRFEEAFGYIHEKVYTQTKKGRLRDYRTPWILLEDTPDNARRFAWVFYNFNIFTTLNYYWNKQVTKECFVELAFDFDAPELELAWRDILKMSEFLQSKQVPYHSFFSGKKGFHIVIGYQIFNQEYQENNHLINKELAKLLFQETGPLTTLDMAIYSSRRQFRLASRKDMFANIPYAYGGTIFLDEVGELTPSLQSKLLRVLQEGEIFRIGGKCPLKINVRVICATNIELFQAVIEKRFREDLFYRLRAAQIRLAPLRERKEDLSPLAQHFLEKYNDLAHANITGYSRKALELLSAHSWPGNIRELEHVIWNAVVIRRHGEIQPDDIDLVYIPCNGDKIEIDIPAGRINFYGFMEAVAGTAAKQLVSVTLARFKGDTTTARESLGLKRWDNVTKKYGINLKELTQSHPVHQETDSNPSAEGHPELNTRQIAAIHHLKANPTITAKEYSQLTQISYRTSIREINKLLSFGLISKTGTSYHTVYELCKPTRR